MIIIVACITAIFLLVEGVSLWRLQQQRSIYRAYWLSRAQAAIPENALVYVALGDSAAVGIGASSPDKGYVGLLADKLKRKSNRPVHVINLGVTGASLEDILDHQLPQLKKTALPPDAIITLAIGANNIRSFEASTFRREFGEILKLIPKQTVIADVPYFGGGRFNTKEKNAEQASQIVAELTTQQGFKLARLHDATKEKDSWFNYAADFFHPNNRAYRIWAEAFWDTINNQL